MKNLEHTLLNIGKTGGTKDAHRKTENKSGLSNSNIGSLEISEFIYLGVNYSESKIFSNQILLKVVYLFFFLYNLYHSCLRFLHIKFKVGRQ